MLINIEKDDLRRAIAKMGGIRLDGDGHQAGGLWGSMARDAHANKSFNFVPGVGLMFKRDAGLPVDRVSQYLCELDYLKTDDLNELRDAIQKTISGGLVWSMQKSSYNEEETPEYGDYPEYDLVPDIGENETEVRTRTAEEEDMYGDIIAFMMGSLDEISTSEDDNKPADIPQTASTEQPEMNKTPLRSHELSTGHGAAKGERLKLSRAEIIKEKLTKATPESRERIKADLLATLTRYELRTGEDMTALKEIISDA